MYPLWDHVIAPVIRATAPRRVVEIGALRGETTRFVLEELGADTELHVIDPVPEFDPAEHERAFPGRYVFHRAPSHDVLAQLPSFDVALIDGDHNWYTVFHELRMLAERATAAGEPLPVLIMHDVGWPYGRRDLYYAPERIPAEHRHDYAQLGMRPGQPGLAKSGGLNPTMNNARREGGPRNGVMTALEDFVEQSCEPIRVVIVPVYFGLAIAVSESRLARHPALAAELDRLESPESTRTQVELAESLRVKSLIFQHAVFYRNEQALARAAARYLALLAGALTGEQHLEQAILIRYLLDCFERGKQPDPDALTDPVRRLPPERRHVVADLDFGGRAVNDLAPATTLGRSGLARLTSCLDTIRTESIPGDLVDCGTGRGGAAVFMRGFLDAWEVGDGRSVVVVDRLASDSAGDLNQVRDLFDRFDLLDEQVRFVQADPPDAALATEIGRTALLRIDASQGVDPIGALESSYHQIATGGFVLVDGCDADTIGRLGAWRDRHGVDEPVEVLGDRLALWRKLHDRDDVGGDPAAVRARAPRIAPLSPETETIDLSIVVVMYDMRREAARTLRSLSRSYQRDVADVDYEVIVIDNGSPPEARLDPDEVASYGPEFRLVSLGDEASPSPVPALNRGAAEARGEHLAFMIDGAHVLTPGVLATAIRGLRYHAPAVVVTQQWYVGPGQQDEAAGAGYDQTAEDRLFERIDWPADGYRLFDIGHFVGDRDWFDGTAESNCLFVPRAVLEQIGGFDEAFSMAGGGYANLDMYERACAAPGVTVVSMLGEGSFHQFHGGTTTNLADTTDRSELLAGFGRHYAELRGRPFSPHGKPFQYLGSLVGSARRTRARRLTAPAFFRHGADVGSDGFPARAEPIHHDLATEFIDTYWRSLAWRRTTWLGEPVAMCPTDIVTYQEMITAVRPDWIIETGRGSGGRTRLLASLCDLVGHGRVISIDAPGAGEAVDHARVELVDSHPLSPRTRRHVGEMVGDGRALLIIGTLGHRHRVLREFEAYHDLVPVGSYVVIESTIVNGRPVWPEFGLGPAEAARHIISSRRGVFAPDRELDRHGLTFQPNGYLRRIS